MEELIIALFVWLGELFVGAYKRIRGWIQGRREQRQPRPGPGWREGTSPVPADASPPPDDPFMARSRQLEGSLEELQQNARRVAQTLKRTAMNEPLCAALEALAVQAQSLRYELGRLRPGPSAAVDQERLAARAAALIRLSGTIRGLIRQREDPRYQDHLAAADGVGRALYEPLSRWGVRQERLPAGLAPLGFFGERDAADGRAFATTLVAPLPVHPSFGAALIVWPLLGGEVGRDLLERVSGLAWEIRHRFGLPDRYPVPFAFRGYLGEDEVQKPFGVWLPTLWGDLVGVLLLGPAYARALHLLLADTDVPARTTAVPTLADGSAYAPRPPAHLRMYFATSALGPLGFGTQGDALWEIWTEEHGGLQTIYLPTRFEGWIEAPVAHFEGVADRLADSLASEPLRALGELSLKSLSGVRFTPEMYEQAKQVSRVLQSGGVPGVPPRVLLAGAVLAALQAPSRAALLVDLLHRAFREEPAARPGRAAAPAAARPAAAPADEAVQWRDVVILGQIMERPGGALSVRRCRSVATDWMSR